MPQVEYSIFKTSLYLAYYSIDFVLGYLWLYYQKGLGNLVVFDRYVYDYSLLKEYSKYPSSLLSLLYKIAPTPDNLFVLYAEPEVIYKRKPELTVEEIKRQQDCCSDVMKKCKTSVKLRTDQNYDKTVNELMFNIYYK